VHSFTVFEVSAISVTHGRQYSPRVTVVKGGSALSQISTRYANKLKNHEGKLATAYFLLYLVLIAKSSTRMNMRVAVAGTCGLALLIAREINDETSHQLVILSRTVSVIVLLAFQLQHLFSNTCIPASISVDLPGLSVPSR
jgi:uncharacterized membrane protein